jgi:hypothetical protein
MLFFYWNLTRDFNNINSDNFDIYQQLFFDFPITTTTRVVGEQIAVTKVVEDQDKTSIEFEEQAIAWTKHQEQVAPSITVDEHNFIPHNTEPRVP